MITPLSSLPLSSNHRVSGITFHPSKPYLAVQSHDRAVEIFRIRTEEEVLKKQARRKKRAKEKKEKIGKEGKGDINEDAEEKDVTLVDLFTPHVVVRASGKIKSFDFGGEDTAGKGVQVCPSVPIVCYSPGSDPLYRYYLHSPQTPWRCITFRRLSSQKTASEKLSDCSQ